MRWMEHIARMGEMMNLNTVLIEETDGKGPLRLHSCRWEVKGKIVIVLN